MLTASQRYTARWLPLGLLLSCQGEPTTPSAISVPSGRPVAAVTDDVVARVTVSPDSQMVFKNDRFTVTAEATNAAGEALERSFTWTVANKRIARALDPLGATTTFKALRVGKTGIKAATDGKSATSIVVVRGLAGAKVVVTPSSATVTPGGTVQFTATGITGKGETASVNVTWSTSGGAISSAGLLSAPAQPGTYRVIAKAQFSAADTATVTVAQDAEPLAAIVLVPASATLASGASLQFESYGLDAGGDSVAAAVTYGATGGSITAAGKYTAGNVEGSFRVIAEAAGGLADTSEVTITPTSPGSSVARVVLLPDVAASRPGVATKFVATAYDGEGDVVSDPITYDATCGSVTSAGIYTAPDPGSGECRVTATVGDESDATDVVLLPGVVGRGVPFGVSDMWSTNTSTVSSGVAAYTGSHDNVAADQLVAHINAARAKGIRLVLNMTGGSHDRYKTNGVFDESKWRAAMDAFDTQANRDAVAEAVADGTIVGNSVMDEPQQSGTGTKAWGPKGTMTKRRVDGLCQYAKGIFATLPVGVFHDPYIFEPDSSYQVCEFLISQYATRKGNVVSWRDAALQLVQRDDMKIIFSLNLLDGGTQDKDGTYDCTGTGGLGTYSPNCRMTPDQVRTYGQALGPHGCGLLSWRYDAAFMGKPENQAALSSIAITLYALPRPPCSRD